jgi:predicted permease
MGFSSRTVRERLWHPLRALFLRRRLERDLDAELRDHLERDMEHRMARGVAPGEARRLALADLGGLGATRDYVRDVHGISAWDALRRDLRHAARRLVRQPGHALLTVATLALGIGVATAVFTTVDGILLRPLPLRDPDALVTLWQSRPAEGIARDDVAPATFLDWRERLTTVTAVSAGNPYSVSLRTPGATERIGAWQVSSDFFTLVGVAPAVGRTFTREDFEGAGARVALLDHGFWLQRFGGDTAIVGSVVQLDEARVTIIGVMPPAFALPERTSLWLPWIPDEPQRADRYGTYLRVFARLADGATVPTAEHELATALRELETMHPRPYRGVGATVVPLGEVLVGAHRPLLWTLLGAAGVLFLVTLANVAALQLTRVARQRRETAIRTALGAGRAGIARPLALESLLLAALGTAAGWAVAWFGVRLLHTSAPAELPRLAEVALDARAGTSAAGLALIAAATLALIAIGRATMPSFSSLASRAVAGSPLARRGRQLAVGVQLAFSLVLLIGTSLLLRSFQQVLSAERGYDTRQLLSYTVWVYDEYPQPQGRMAFASTVIERLRALPGVRDAALGSALPLADQVTGEVADIVMDGTAIAPGEEPQARGLAVWPTYFGVLGIARRAGRLLDARDDASGERVVVVNEAFARRFSPDRDPVGRMVAVGLMGRAVPRRIVGVVADTRHARLDAEPDPAAYIPWLQQPIAAMSFVVRTDAPPASLAPAVTRLMFELDPRLGLGNLATMDALLELRLRERRFLLTLLSVFAGGAILLAAIGVFGVMSQSVVERRREIGVRLALGASPRAIARELSREATRLGVGGLAAGIVLAAVGVRAISGFLYRVAPFDALALVGAIVVLLATTVLAALAPTLRAVRTDPLVVLQDE